jgi:starch-binding outer membrane protein, SusD/RagB family
MKHSHIYLVHLLLTCLLLVCTALFSCRRWVEIDMPIDKITAAKTFSSNETATAAVLGLYSQMMPTLPFFSCGGTSIYAGLSSDELLLTSTTSTEETEFQQNKLSASNGTISLNFWQRAYKLIYQANACIEGLQASPTLKPGVKDQLLAESRFTRAWIYYYLVNLFGDVPLVLTTDYKLNATLPRALQSQVYQQIVQDLLQAKSALPATYPTAGKVRPNKWAAAALLARVYLHLQDWNQAETEATDIISSGTYGLVTNLNNVFLANSNEAIWQLAPVESGFNTTESRYFVPVTTATVKPTYILSPALLSAFETGDVRRTSWVASKTIAPDVFYYPFKYKVRNVGLPVTENYMVMRYAEVLLIRAEARAQQDKITEAKLDLNAIRSRASLAGTTANTKQDLLTAVEKERRIEFFAEWGHRWIDLKRTGRVDLVLGTKPNWTSTGALYPIPLNDMLRNPFLKQNPGY